MNKLLNAFIDLIKNFDKGELAMYPDPAPPADLGSPLTQDEIDFVKELRKEMVQRFDTTPPPPSCTDEKISPAVTSSYYTSVSIGWINPAGYIGSTVTYRQYGSTEWLIPNAVGNATGVYLSEDGFEFQTGMMVGTAYEILLQNTCASGLLSEGVILLVTPTDAA